MPKSKRRKLVSLTQTKKKGLETKQKLVDEIRSCIENYEKIFVFSTHHVKTNKLKQMRQDWEGSRFFLGKNKVMSLALGRSPEEELYDNLYKISQKLVGHCGLFFTNSEKDEVLKYFEENKFSVPPSSGDIATETVELKAGLLEQFAHSLEPHLRKLGLPTRLQRAVPELLKDFTVCVEGKPLTVNEANILRLFGKEMAVFRLQMEWVWNKDGQVERLGGPETDTKVAGKRKKDDEESEESEDEDMDDEEIEN